jgi:hypothetical protein
MWWARWRAPVYYDPEAWLTIAILTSTFSIVVSRLVYMSQNMLIKYLMHAAYTLAGDLKTGTRPTLTLLLLVEYLIRAYV